MSQTALNYLTLNYAKNFYTESVAWLVLSEVVLLWLNFDQPANLGYLTLIAHLNKHDVVFYWFECSIHQRALFKTRFGEALTFFSFQRHQQELTLCLIGVRD